MSNKTWLKMKRGLFRDPKHRQNMGESIWLFGWLIDSADWETGVVSPYKDDDVVSELAVSLSWVRKHRRKLAELGYVECSQRGPQGMTIKIANWTNPKSDGQQGADKSVSKGGTNEALFRGKGDTESGTTVTPYAKTRKGDTNETPLSPKGDTESDTESVANTIGERDTLYTLYPDIKNHLSGNDENKSRLVFELYLSTFSEPPISAEDGDLDELIAIYSIEDIREAMLITKRKNSHQRIARKVAYMRSILQGWAKNGKPETIRDDDDDDDDKLPIYGIGRRLVCGDTVTYVKG